MNIRAEKIIFSLVIAIILVTFNNVAFTHADIVEDLKSKIDQTSDKVKYLEAQIAAYNNQLKQTQSEKNTLNNAIKTLDINKQIITKDISLTEVKIDTANQSLLEVETGISDLNARIRQNKDFIKESLRLLASDDSYSEPDLLTNILATDSISDAFDRTSNLEDFQRKLVQNLNQIKNSRSELEQVQLIKQEQRNELFNLNQELIAKQKIVEQTKSQKAALLSSTKSKESAYQAQLSKVKKQKQDLEQEIMSYEEQIRIAVDPSTLPKSGSKVLKYPISKVVITQYFGNTPFASQNPQVYSGGGHNGVDFSASVGTRIMSAASGVIQGTGDTDKACRGASYGKWVLVRHNNGLSTLYAHLSVISVSPGQAVSQGDIVGLSGNTGYSTGPHLHFTVYATKAVSIVTRQSKACGTMMTLPVSSLNGYLNPLSFL